MTRQQLEIVARIFRLCEELPATRDRLDVINLAWLAFASSARTEALSIPGGFPAERARQIHQLHAIADLIAPDAPDLETDRLFYEGDFEGMARRLQHLMARYGSAA